MTRRGMFGLLLAPLLRLPGVERDPYTGDFDSWHRAHHEALLRAQDGGREKKLRLSTAHCSVCGRVYVAGMWLGPNCRIRSVGSGGEA